MSLFQITMLVLLCIFIAMNLMIVYKSRTSWTNAFLAGLCTGGVIDVISYIICK